MINALQAASENIRKALASGDVEYAFKIVYRHFESYGPGKNAPNPPAKVLKCFPKDFRQDAANRYHAGCIAWYKAGPSTSEAILLHRSRIILPEPKFKPGQRVRSKAGTIGHVSHLLNGHYRELVLFAGYRYSVADSKGHRHPVDEKSLLPDAEPVASATMGLTRPPMAPPSDHRMRQLGKRAKARSD